MNDSEQPTQPPKDQDNESTTPATPADQDRLTPVLIDKTGKRGWGPFSNRGPHNITTR